MPDWGWIVLAVAVVFGASKLPEHRAEPRSILG